MFQSFSLLFFRTVVATLTCALVLFQTHPAHSHEVLPTIADLSLQDNGVLRLDLRVNLEALLSGIDLDAVSNTDEAEGAEDYDVLHALAPAQLQERAQDLVSRWSQDGLITVQGAAVPLVQAMIEVPEITDFELPRISLLSLEGQMPPDAETLTANWPIGSGPLVLRQQGVTAPYTGFLNGGQSSPPIALAGSDLRTGWEVFVDYIPVGFDIILPKGLDHVLFVLGLFLLSTRFGPLLWQVSAFTVAYTVTLVLGALGWIGLPSSIVEPLIALSIVYVAVENVFTSGLTRWRPWIVLGFGLLHGLGFASALRDFGLPEAQALPALAGFAVGVELGQLAVIALAALLLVLAVWLARRMYLPETEAPVASYPVMFRAVSIPGSLLIAAVGAYWCVERVLF